MGRGKTAANRFLDCFKLYLSHLSQGWHIIVKSLRLVVCLLALVALLWLVFYCHISFEMSTLKRVPSPVHLADLGTAKLTAVVNDVIVPTNPGRDFQFDAFLSTAPSNQGHWRHGIHGLSALPISVLASIALADKDTAPPSEKEREKLLDRAKRYLVEKEGRNPDHLLPEDVERQYETELVFYYIHQLRQSNDYSVLHDLYNELLERDIEKPISVSVEELPHFRQYKIKQVILLPVFNYIGKKPAFTVNKLSDRITQGVTSSLFYLKNNVHQLAIPALAGTEKRADSRFYLTYGQSFRAILRGLASAQAIERLKNSPVHTIHLVIWNKLKKNEFSAAFKGLKSALFCYRITSGTIFLIIIASLVSAIRFSQGSQAKKLIVLGTAAALMALVTFINPDSIKNFQWWVLYNLGIVGLFIAQTAVVFLAVILSEAFLQGGKRIAAKDEENQKE